MAYNITLNKNKSIGKVVYIVEGQQKEITLLSYIYEKIFNYTVINVKREKKPYLKCQSKENPDSQVFIISATQSNINTIINKQGKDYIDAVFLTLFESYGLDTTNCAVYYIFDRDNQSNNKIVCLELINNLKNSRDNGYETNGLLLLSYPAIESYIKSTIDINANCEYFACAAQLKAITSQGKYQYNKINEANIILACNNMLISQFDIIGEKFIPSILDNYASTNNKLFEYEENLYNN